MTLEVPDLDNISELPLNQCVLGPILRARAERDPDKIYIRFGDKAWTFAKLSTRCVTSRAAWLHWDLKKGSVQGFSCPMTPASYSAGTAPTQGYVIARNAKPQPISRSETTKEAP